MDVWFWNILFEEIVMTVEEDVRGDIDGLVASTMVFAMQIYVVDRGGPLFVSMYLPLQTLLAALIATVTLGKEFYLGGVVGAALIIAGLYMVILGKSEESKYLSENEPIYSVSENNDMESTFIRPLLGNKLQS
ncbi:WAT1-related protein At3g53210-like [Gossypium hirsutum]|uniref:WAT1-related protein At3g53210-like n=1 Tax=Gossypium hirsutum TaxID=3635 RepID=A0A1U8P7N3_GOSHI|nr:WAT1-related protein At3g53210-like [Gossypium hirsutum]